MKGEIKVTDNKIESQSITVHQIVYSYITGSRVISMFNTGSGKISLQHVPGAFTQSDFSLFVGEIKKAFDEINKNIKK